MTCCTGIPGLQPTGGGVHESWPCCTGGAMMRTAGLAARANSSGCGDDEAGLADRVEGLTERCREAERCSAGTTTTCGLACRTAVGVTFRGVEQDERAGEVPERTRGLTERATDVATTGPASATGCRRWLANSVRGCSCRAVLGAAMLEAGPGPAMATAAEGDAAPGPAVATAAAGGAVPRMRRSRSRSRRSCSSMRANLRAKKSWPVASPA
mmetsp:Transcript_98739/g.313319  ORF Transcript_98739/g.313319 Transcript_98739/m.313319 type:complete len:212 (+) Transcript_98739:427-1062(+)